MRDGKLQSRKEEDEALDQYVRDTFYVNLFTNLTRLCSWLTVDVVTRL